MSARLRHFIIRGRNTSFVRNLFCKPSSPFSTTPVRTFTNTTPNNAFSSSKRPSTALTRVWNPQEDLIELPEHGIPIKPKSRVSVLGTLLWLIPVCTLGLGTWQLYRLGWKLRLIEELEDRLDMPIVRLPKIITPRTFDNLRFRRVYVSGNYLHDKEIHLGPRPKPDLGPGYFVITPLQREDGQIILVRRGWVSNDKKERQDRPKSVVPGEEVKIVGVIRGDDFPTIFQVDDNPTKNEWHRVNVKKMAEHVGADPILVEQLTETELTPTASMLYKDTGIPIAEVPVVDVRNTHLQYAWTWFGVSACTAIGLTLAMKQPKKVKFR